MAALGILLERVADQYSWLLLPIALVVFVVVCYDRLLRIGKDILGVYDKSKRALRKARCSHSVRTNGKPSEFGTIDSILATVQGKGYRTDNPEYLECTKCWDTFAVNSFELDFHKKAKRIAKKEGWDNLKRTPSISSPIDDIALYRLPKDEG